MGKAPGKHWLMLPMLRLAAYVGLIVLVGCTEGSDHPFRKVEGQSEVLRPPDENYIAAGPGAEREIDYETLYGPGRIGPMVQANSSLPQRELGTESTDGLAMRARTGKTYTSAKRRVIRAVSVISVEGATATANAELKAAMRDVLSSAGWPVISVPREDALTISGNMNFGPREKDLQKITVSWTVSTFDGNTVGTVEQGNSVPVGSVENDWHDTASAIASTAAGGIFELVGRLR
jgi:hypothetical protein